MAEKQDTEYVFHEKLETLLLDTPEESITSRALYQDSQTKVILFSFAAGQGLSEHSTPKIAFIQVVSGSGKITLGEDEYSVKAGSWLQMPASLPHSVIADESLVMVLTMVNV
jgi:quercetin dioxygenase-like cupin family protein